MFIEGWAREVDRTALAMAALRLRSIAVTSTSERSGVSSLSRDLARAFALSGTKLLLVDLTASADPDGRAIIWQPGVGGAGQAIESGGDGYDVLKARFDASTRYRFNNIELLRRSLNDELAHYHAMIVDLPPLNARSAMSINAAAAAAACDGVVLVCVTGRLRNQQLIASIDELTLAGAKLVGTVINNVECPTLGVELARQARRLSRVLPAASTWLQRKALASPFLN